jgi:hypothetical protein
VTSRRSFLNLALCFAGLHGRAGATTCDSALLARAIERAGGLAALSSVKGLRWSGTASIHAGERLIEIGVSTSVQPFTRARSDSWLLAEGPAKSRSLIIDGSAGWLERAGQRTAMPAAMLTHERAQYAIYGLMLLTPLCALDAPRVRVAGNSLLTAHPAAPATTLLFDELATLVGARNSVPSPDDGSAVAQEFLFADHRRTDGILWPHRLELRQRGNPYFELAVEHFAVERCNA